MSEFGLWTNLVAHGSIKTESFKIDLGLIAEYVGSDIFAEQRLCCNQ